jgi:hypothetical protein
MRHLPNHGAVERALALLLRSRGIFWEVCLNRSVSRADTSAVRFAEGLVQIQQVRYFLTLCEELHFTRAARRCGVSQPSLTTAISALERELGGALFDRKPSIALTELGRLVRPYLDEIARNADHAREVARTLTPRPVADRSARQAVDRSDHPSN